MRNALARCAAVAFLALALGGVTPALAGATSKYCADAADNVIIYVDKTTPYDDVDKKELVDGISRLFESLKGGERLSMRTIADSFTASTSMIDECIPFCADGGLFGDLFGSCTEGVMLNDKKHLKGVVVGQLEALLANFAELPNSEIVRTLGLTLPTEMRPGRSNKVFLFTDLIENSTYLTGKDFFSKKNDVLLQRVQADHLIPDLKGTSVSVFGVGRAGIPGDRHPLDQKLLSKIEDFWTRYFAQSGAAATISQSLGVVN